MVKLYVLSGMGYEFRFRFNFEVGLVSFYYFGMEGGGVIC